MAKDVLIDEFHISFFVSRRLSAEEARPIRAALNGRDFRRSLQTAIRELIAKSPSLRKATVRISQ